MGLFSRRRPVTDLMVSGGIITPTRVFAEMLCLRIAAQPADVRLAQPDDEYNSLHLPVAGDARIEISWRPYQRARPVSAFYVHPAKPGSILGVGMPGGGSRGKYLSVTLTGGDHDMVLRELEALRARSVALRDAQRDAENQQDALSLVEAMITTPTPDEQSQLEDDAR